MMTRILALALAATGLSVGGFQLGTRQVQTSPIPEAAPANLPAGHALTVALQERATPVTPAEKVRLRLLALEMERAKKVEETKRIQALNSQIADLERQIVENQTLRYLDLRTPEGQKQADKMLGTSKVKGTSVNGGKSFPIRYRAVPNKEAIVKLQAAERVKAQKIVEDRFEAIAIGSLQTTTAARVQAETLAKRVQEGERGFALLIALRERAALNLAPKQVTQLQLLQADFLRRYAPLREEAETGTVLEVVGQAIDGKKPVEIRLGEVKFDSVPAKVIDIVKADSVKVEGVQTSPAKPAEFRGKAKEDVLYFVEVAPDKVVSGRTSVVAGKSVPAKGAKEVFVQNFTVSFAHPINDVEKRIQALKDEIDDKVFEILNDDQGKRLRRMVAISLSPNP